MKPEKRIALVAHDARKKDMLEWVNVNILQTQSHKLWATSTTGRTVLAPPFDDTKHKVK